MDAQQTDGFFIPVGQPVPPAELLGKVLLVHPVMIGGHRIVLQIDDIGMLRHGPHPKLFFCVIPGIPEHLVAADAGASGHGQADPVQLHRRIPFQPGKGPLHIFGGYGILCLKILMENADLFGWVISLLKIQRHVQKQAAVLSAGKGDKDIVEFPEDKMHPLLEGVINIFIGILPNHIITHRNPLHLASSSGITGTVILPAVTSHPYRFEKYFRTLPFLYLFSAQMLHLDFIHLHSLSGNRNLFLNSRHVRVIFHSELFQRHRCFRAAFDWTASPKYNNALHKRRPCLLLYGLISVNREVYLIAGFDCAGFMPRARSVKQNPLIILVIEEVDWDRIRITVVPIDRQNATPGIMKKLFCGFYTDFFCFLRIGLNMIFSPKNNSIRQWFFDDLNDRKSQRCLGQLQIV